MCVYIYMYIYIYVYVCIYIYIYRCHGTKCRSHGVPARGICAPLLTVVIEVLGTIYTFSYTVKQLKCKSAVLTTNHSHVIEGSPTVVWDEGALDHSLSAYCIPLACVNQTKAKPVT